MEKREMDWEKRTAQTLDKAAQAIALEKWNADNGGLLGKITMTLETNVSKADERIYGQIVASIDLKDGYITDKTANFICALYSYVAKNTLLNSMRSYVEAQKLVVKITL